MTISAEIIADSITSDGQRITTFELIYPRMIHAENLTHRIFSRNSASSRAIPVNKMNDLILSNVALPWRFGKANKGMQDAGEHDEPVFVEAIYEKELSLGSDPEKARELASLSPENAWRYAASLMVDFSNYFNRAGYAKQVCNRLTEPFQHMKVVVTSTSFDNFFNLRNHTDADPTLHMLAVTVLEAYKNSEPRVLLKGEWHTPYYQSGFWSEHSNGKDIHGNTLEDALMISASCCAQVSYRTLDDSLEKARRIYKALIETEPTHASPVEHQATPIPKFNTGSIWPEGITHMDRLGAYYSGNFKGWIQHRQLIPNHVCEEYEGYY